MNAPQDIAALSRRQLAAGVVAWLAAGVLAVRPMPSVAAGRTLPLSTSLSDELARALAGGAPLVIMVSLTGCPWCEEVRNNYLAPMHAAEGLPVVQLDMRSNHLTVTLQGQITTHDAQVRAWDVRAAPTVLFLGRGGREIADRLVGGAPDFYHAYLERRLEQARKALVG